MNLLEQSPVERAMSQHVDRLVARVQEAIGAEPERVAAVVLFSFLSANPEVSQAFEALCSNWILPMTLRNTRSIFEGDRALNAALRRTR
jgi:hypothetical protein